MRLALLDHLEAVDREFEARQQWSDFARRSAVYYVSVSGNQMGKGSIHRIPGFVDPLVRYRLSDEGMNYLREGVLRLNELLFCAGARRLFFSNPGARAVEQQDLKRIAQIYSELVFSNMMTIHIFSSCPMGGDRSRAVVDPYGKVYGEKGLHVADASLLPSSPTVNPQGTIMAFAKRNALKFLSERSRTL